MSTHATLVEVVNEAITEHCVRNKLDPVEVAGVLRSIAEWVELAADDICLDCGQSGAAGGDSWDGRCPECADIRFIEEGKF